MSRVLPACEAARILVEAARSGEGGLKGFNEYHVLEALRRMIVRPSGRPRLARELGLGEASVKTLIKTLRSMGLAVRCGTGHCASEKGRRVAGSLEGICIGSPLRVEGIGDAAIVLAPQLRPPSRVVEVYEVRDYLVARGCKPVVVGGFWPPLTVSFPGTPPDIEASLASHVLRIIEEARCGVDVDGATIAVVPAACASEAASALIEAIAGTCEGH
jgi:biotin operon repressor